MRLAVMGAGAVGGYVGGRLAAAGEDLAFIARGAHLQAMRANGLRIESPSGDLHLPKVTAVADPAGIGPVDVVLFTVKLWDTELAAQSLMPLIGPHTRIITLQNGIDSVDLISRRLPATQIVGGVIYVSVVVAEPGMIRSTGGPGRLLVDHANGDDVVAGFITACGRATGIEIHATSSIQTTVWEKFIGLCASSGSTALLRSTMGPILANTETRAFVLQLVEEGAAIAKAAGIRVRDDVVEATMALLASVPPNFRASMAEDLLRGRRLELNWLAGRMHALGLQHSIPTPAQTAVYRGLLLHANGAQRSSLLA